MGPLLRDIPPARLFEEVCKLFLTGHGSRSMEALQRFGLSSILFPSLMKGNGPGKIQMGPLLKKALENTDERVRDSKPVTPAFLFAALLWQPVRDRARALVGKGESEYNAMMLASEEVIGAQVGSTAIPRRFSAVTRQIWTMQPRFAKTRGRRWRRVFHEPRFRAGYDFLLLRAFEDPSLSESCDFWTKAQEGMDFSPKPGSRRERPRRRYRRSGSGQSGSSRSGSRG
jgi:poly(A) polymerase